MAEDSARVFEPEGLLGYLVASLQITNREVAASLVEPFLLRKRIGEDGENCIPESFLAGEHPPGTAKEVPDDLGNFVCFDLGCSHSRGVNTGGHSKFLLVIRRTANHA